MIAEANFFDKAGSRWALHEARIDLVAYKAIGKAPASRRYFRPASR